MKDSQLIHFQLQYLNCIRYNQYKRAATLRYGSTLGNIRIVGAAVEFATEILFNIVK